MKYPDFYSACFQNTIFLGRPVKTCYFFFISYIMSLYQTFLHVCAFNFFFLTRHPKASCRFICFYFRGSYPSYQIIVY